MLFNIYGEYVVDNEVITSIDAVTPEWLTKVLRQSGALESGEVEGIDSQLAERDNSNVASLTVVYAAGSKGELPHKLFLKMVYGQVEDGSFGPSEVHYYARDYVGLEQSPIPRSYTAAHSKQLQRYHVLMDDLSATHMNGFNKAPTLAYGLALAEGLAKLHAHWWGADRLRRGGESVPEAATIRRFIDIAKPGLQHILEYADNQLEPHWPAALLEIFEAHPVAMVQRTQRSAGFTLIHGDVNPGNILVPLEGDSPIYLIDRQPFDWSLTTWLGAYDLSYAIVHWWETETRRNFEQAMLRRYHECLVAQGVDDYSFDQLYADYRLAAVMSVYVATEWCRRGIREDLVKYWRPMLHKSMQAFDDLECRALWAG
jgi:thiamine kinase-like enzyme